MAASVPFSVLRKQIEDQPEEFLSTSLLPSDEKAFSEFLTSFINDKEYLREHPNLMLRMFKILPSNIASNEYECFSRVVQELAPRTSFGEFEKLFWEIPILHNPGLRELSIRMCSESNKCSPETVILTMLFQFLKNKSYEAADKLLDNPSLVGHKDRFENDLLFIVMSKGLPVHIDKMFSLYKQSGLDVKDVMTSNSIMLIREQLFEDDHKLVELITLMRDQGVDLATELQKNDFWLIKICNCVFKLNLLLDLLSEDQRKMALTSRGPYVLFNIINNQKNVNKEQELTIVLKMLTDHGLQLSYVLTRRNSDFLTPLDFACLGNQVACAKVIIQNLEDTVLFDILRTINHGQRTTLYHCSYYHKHPNCAPLIEMEMKRLSEIFQMPCSPLSYNGEKLSDEQLR